MLVVGGVAAASATPTSGRGAGSGIGGGCWRSRGNTKTSAISAATAAS
ncbi:MAG: hypothetical protein NWP31_00170 [Solirubrobacteraceae bacterium]|nr:hypothetical protein [Solirubrobacteraceae bacterium]